MVSFRLVRRPGGDMRVAAILFSFLLLCSQAQAAPAKPADFGSSDLVLSWINGYRQKPEPDRLPIAIQH